MVETVNIDHYQSPFEDTAVYQRHTDPGEDRADRPGYNIHEAAAD